MKLIKYLSTLVLFSLLAIAASAQDAVVIDTGNFVRGTIQGTDFLTVGLKKDDGTLEKYSAKDIKEFLWNGETFVSKPFVTNKKTDYRFFKLVEAGKLNLYSMGGSTGLAEKPKRRVRFSPSIGLGIGTGGYSGVGIGGGVSFGGRRDDDDRPRRERRALYYIEKPGSGEMLEITPDNSDTNTQYIKNTLMEKMSDDKDLTERIKGTEYFDVKSIVSLVKNYNSVHQ
ncbi:hypothetical protein TH53_19130 [Pedobacter lusitanus]|uniref:Uncharacterized protein n=1 Tax=Pedobacter lusitanus TaxID=1503925 RepID=A0A0D0GEF0_9SPHI|nr:hypothetical protein [Pedobacter lusitanus]KIO75692.1 hypothetical protein TH53_19130 [Pedobacter lusitanus]